MIGEKAYWIRRLDQPHDENGMAGGLNSARMPIRSIKADIVAKRISRCVELLEQDQAIYYDGPHSGHLLTMRRAASMPAPGPTT
jgi:hypothetical protein